MNKRLIASIIMCYVCAALLWLNTTEWFVSIIVIAASSIALKVRFKAKLRPFVYTRCFLLLATLFAIKCRLSEADEQALSLQPLLLTNCCQYLIFAMVLSIMVRQSDHIGSWVAVCGILVMVLLDKIDNSTGRLEYLFILLNVGCAVVLWFSPRTNANYIGIKKTKNIAIIAIMALAVNANWTHHDTLYKQYRSGIKHVFASREIASDIGIDKEQRVGFSLLTKKIATDKIEPDGGDQIVAQVFSNICPKYLIGKIYDRYNEGRWDSKDEYDLVLPDKRFAGDDSQKVFVLDPLSAEDKGDVFEVRHLREFDGVIFSVSDTVAISIDADSLLYNNWGDILCHNAKDKSYKVYSSDSKQPKPPSDNALSRLISVPNEIREELNDIAEKIFSGHHTTAEKVRALHQFWENAEFTFDLNFPTDEEPVVYMVKNKAPAHCELYASAACMLLRLGDVPTRYTTGFAISDRQDGYWVVQNKDAHAWAQAWDTENSQWVNVDIQTSSNNRAPMGRAAQNNSLSILQRFKAAWLNNGIAGAAKLSAKVISAFCVAVTNNRLCIVAIIIAATCLAAVLAYKVRQICKTRSENDSDVEKIQKKLHKMDKLLQKRGLIRKPSETTIQFARRLALQGPCYDNRNEHIRWYKQYSQIRYSEKYN